MDRAPDLIPSWWDDAFLLEQSDPNGSADDAVTRATGPIWHGVEFSGSHRLDGIFAMSGGPVKSGHSLEGAHIVDVAPTVLYLMGLPIPDGMDGKPLVDGIDSDYVRANPPETVESEDEEHSDADGEGGFNSEESELVAQRLKALGYI